MDYAQKIEANQKLHEKANQMRGLFLHRTSVIEQLITSILTDQAATRSEEIKLRKMSLSHKRTILFKEIEEKVLHYWEDNKRHLEPLEDIIALRNCLAHSPFDVSDTAHERPLTEGVVFEGWNNGNQ